VRRPTVAVLAATLAGALVVLVTADVPARAWWYRGYVALVSFLALRAVVAWVDNQKKSDVAAAFRRPRWRRRSTPHVPARPSARLLQLASFSAGEMHRGLRPALQEIAEERLHAHHGLSLADPRAATMVSPATWELLRPDRATPHDLRSAGLDVAAVDALLDDLERL